MYKCPFCGSEFKNPKQFTLEVYVFGREPYGIPVDTCPCCGSLAPVGGFPKNPDPNEVKNWDV